MEQKECVRKAQKGKLHIPTRKGGLAEPYLQNLNTNAKSLGKVWKLMHQAWAMNKKNWKSVQSQSCDCDQDHKDEMGNHA